MQGRGRRPEAEVLWQRGLQESLARSVEQLPWPARPLDGVIVVDNALAHADRTRAFALRQTYDVTGNFPGARTGSFARELPGFRSLIEAALHAPVTYWPETGEDHNVAFQIVEDDSHTWIHRDYTEWAAVLFLTPNAPRDSGTCFYRHVPSGIEWMDPVEDWELEEAMILETTNAASWEQTACVDNVFNRLVIYQGGKHHRAQGYFGSSAKTGRLFMTFFFALSASWRPERLSSEPFRRES